MTSLVQGESAGNDPAIEGAATVSTDSTVEASSTHRQDPEHPLHSGDPFTAAPPAHIPPKETLTAAGDILRALAAPVRIAIVLQLRESERCVHELVVALGVTQPLISQHLRVLKAAGVVRGERNGREVLYRLVDDHLSHIVVDAVAHAEEGRNL
ncbi:MULTISPECIES: metalloregulator ArsR/SmtB family transcription factor [unclassified Rhodococcus (in: high G+C Gram-positive bacteria)]|uniref:ArsR/SmtB family transcription factor n=1 Tax=unclassified Rhodococcus (in: high G+C Gram-positive bacteria) TaxID=192944 RepID=UPI0026D9E5FE|nr:MULTISPECIES: metalloregulator ArsR/SmtB family transcription factor [unclassified Rhodococcus (in: high G+C Gram-positive bacteria)]